MAKVIASEQNNVAKPWWVKANSVAYGAAAGVSWWVLTSLISNYIIEPFACRDLTMAVSCMNSFGTSGSIAAVIVAVVFAYLFVRVLQPRPVVVTFASLILLWDLGSYATGLSWWNILLSGIVLYAISYTLFARIAQMRTLWLSAVIALFIAITIRLLLTL